MSDGSSPEDKSDGAEPVDHDLIIGDDQALIRQLFARLSPAEQEVLELRVIAGLSAEQVGEVLGRNPAQCARRSRAHWPISASSWRSTMDSRRGHVSDEELLTQLAASFAVEESEPDAASLRQLSLAVAELHRPVVTAPTTRPTHRRRELGSLPRRLSPVAAAGAVVAALAMGSGISYAVGGPAPAVVRSVVRTVGLAPAPAPATPSARQ